MDGSFEKFAKKLLFAKEKLSYLIKFTFLEILIALIQYYVFDSFQNFSFL